MRKTATKTKLTPRLRYMAALKSYALKPTAAGGKNLMDAGYAIGKTKVVVQSDLKKAVKSSARRPNPDPISTFANLAVGVASALQIHEHMNKTSRKKKPVRKAARRNPVAASKARVTNHGGRKIIDRKLGKGGNLYMLTIGSGDDLESIYLHDGKGNGFSRRFKTLTGARSHAKRHGYKLIENPAPIVKARIVKMIKANPGLLSGVKSAAKRAIARGRAKRELGKELRTAAKLQRIKSRKRKAIAAATENPKRRKVAVGTTVDSGDAFRLDVIADRAKRYGVTQDAVARATRAFYGGPGSGALSRAFPNGCTLEDAIRYQAKKTNPRKKTARVTRRARTNPTTTAKRRTYEMFQGRPATNVRQMNGSALAPQKLDQLGGLVELKLSSGRVLKFNPSRVALAAAGGKLWIAGAKILKANPAQRTNEIVPVLDARNNPEHVEHVVYTTHKPHHGDAPGTHYIHRLGEDTGHRPTLCVDRDGYPVLRGGQYKIEARGIVN